MQNHSKILLILLITLSICNNSYSQKYTEKYIKDASKVAEIWLNNMDNYNFDLTYKMMDNQVKDIYDSLAWYGYFNDLVSEFGKKEKKRKILSREFKSKIDEIGNGFFVEINYEAFFQKTKNFKETILLKQNDNSEWKVIGYQPIWDNK